VERRGKLRGPEGRRGFCSAVAGQAERGKRAPAERIVRQLGKRTRITVYRDRDNGYIFAFGGGGRTGRSGRKRQEKAWEP